MTSDQKDQDPFTTLSNIEAEEPEWLWRPYLALGEVTIMEGDPGLGKSYLAMHITAQVSIGGSLPGINKLQRCKVLYLSAEDDPAYTIRPRIEQMGGDLDRIRIREIHAELDEKGLEQLRKEIHDRPPGLIVIDPLPAYVPPGADIYKPTVIRPLLNEIRKLAQYADAAALVVRHLVKSKRDKAIYQGAGSIDVIGFARSCLMLGEHPDDTDLKVLAHGMNNIGPKGKSLTFKLVETPNKSHPELQWRGTIDMTADELQSALPGQSNALKTAINFLRNFLKEEPMPAKELLATAEKLAISKRTLDRAKDELHVKSYKDGKVWFWKLPETSA